ncbi:Sodium-coupled neutral amino acid transporter, partial [Globisporangium splendens]
MSSSLPLPIQDDDNASAPLSSISTKLAADSSLDVAPTSANAPLSTGPFVDPGVYRYERNRRSHEFFSPGPHSKERTATASSAIFNLVSTIIGGGILSLPYAFDKCGIVLAVVFMIISAAASNFSLYVIVSCSRRGGAMTYEEVVRKALGPKAGLVTVTLLVMLTFLTMVAYVILMKDLVGSLGGQFLFGRETTTMEKNILTVLCVSLVSPVLFARSMDALRFTSIFSLLSVLVLAIAITFRALTQIQPPDDANPMLNPNPVEVKWFPTNWADPVYAFPIISVSFLCHFNVLPVYRELHKPTRHRLKKIVSSTMFSTWVFYMIVGTMGYMFAYRFPTGVQDDILNNFGSDDNLVNCGRLGLLVTIMLSMPLIMQPCRLNIIRLSKYVSGFVKSSRHDEDVGLLTTPTALPQAVTPSVSFLAPNSVHAMLTIVIITGVMALAFVLPGVAVVWNMMGSTVGILISYVLPCISYAMIRKKKPNTDKRKLTAYAIFAISSIVCVACTFQAFASVLAL